MDLELLLQKKKENKEYIDDHIANVKKAFDIIVDIANKAGIPWLDKGISICIETDRISMHDASKYSDEEFEPYRKNFFPVSDEEKASAEEEFEEAWSHHKEYNPHHWEHWLSGNEPEDIPNEFIVEMIADWLAMSIKFDNKLSTWYDDNKAKMKLSDSTLIKVEELIGLTEEHYYDK